VILLDTHVWVRWLAPWEHPLPVALTDVIASDPDACVSAISHWEVAYLHKRGRLTLGIDLSEWLHEATAGSGIRTVDVTPSIAARSASLADVHRDPADRFIIATALDHGCQLLSLDQSFPLDPELDGRLIAA